jgi:hypothetical protein
MVIYPSRSRLEEIAIRRVRREKRREPEREPEPDTRMRIDKLEVYTVPGNVLFSFNSFFLFLFTRFLLPP